MSPTLKATSMNSTKYRRAAVKDLIIAFDHQLMEGSSLLESFRATYPGEADRTYEIMEGICQTHNFPKYLFDYQVEAIKLGNFYVQNRLNEIQPDPRFPDNFLKTTNKKIAKIFGKF